MVAQHDRKDYYAILGVSRNATAEDIKTAFKALALQWHPDRTQHAGRKEEAGKRFIEINEAYSYLMERHRRPYPGSVPRPQDPKPKSTKPKFNTKQSPPSSPLASTSSPRSSSAPSSPSSSPGVSPSSTPASSPPTTPKSASKPVAKPVATPAPKPAPKVPPPDFRRQHSDPGPRTRKPSKPSSPKASGEKLPRARSSSVNRTDYIKRAPRSEGGSSSSGRSDSQRSDSQRSDSQGSTSSGSTRTAGSQKAEEEDLNQASTNADDTEDDVNGQRIRPTFIPENGVPDEWIFPLELTLDELKQGVSLRFRITRHLLSKKKKSFYVNVHVQPGWKAGTKVRFPGLGNERTGGLAPQDLVFIVSEAKHEKYVRVGDNLETKVEISLEEALAGPVRHKLVRGLGEKSGWMEVQVPEDFAKTGAQTVVSGAGMPIRKEGKVIGKGDLIVKWDVQFPSWLSPDQKQNWRGLFPKT